MCYYLFMLLIIFSLIAIGASLGTYFGCNFHHMSLWFLLLLIPFFIGYFGIALNIYWGFILLRTIKYRKVYVPIGVDKVNLYCIRLLTSFVMFFMGLRVKANGFEKPQKEAGLYLFNHIAYYDAWCIYKVMKGTYTFVGKKGLRNTPIIGNLAASLGALYVEKGDAENNKMMMDVASKFISEKGISVAVAPEGTRDMTGQVLPFKHGCFHIAINSKCPIYLIGIRGMEKMLKKHRVLPVTVELELFDKIKYEEYKDLTAGAIAEMCEKKYRDYLGQ